MDRSGTGRTFFSFLSSVKRLNIKDPFWSTSESLKITCKGGITSLLRASTLKYSTFRPRAPFVTLQDPDRISPPDTSQPSVPPLTTPPPRQLTSTLPEQHIRISTGARRTQLTHYGSPAVGQICQPPNCQVRHRRREVRPPGKSETSFPHTHMQNVQRFISCLVLSGWITDSAPRCTPFKKRVHL